LGIVIVWPSFTPSDSAPARDVAPTLTRSGGGRAAREPRVAGQKDARDVGALGVDQRGLALEERQDEPTAVAQPQRTVGVDRVDAEADLIQVRHDHDGTVTLARADPEIARGIGFCADPARKEALHGGSDRRFHARDAIALDELAQH
jgi:hypothetical protein